MCSETRRCYLVWHNMLRRCYNKNCRDYVRYGGRGVTVCTEWHDFETFKEWCDTNYYKLKNETVELDKDLIGSGLYSPENCVFIPHSINSTLQHGRSTRSGCQRHGNKWTVLVNNPLSRKAEYVGLYSTLEDARIAYLSRKTELMRELTTTYKDLIPEKVFVLLINYKFN